MKISYSLIAIVHEQSEFLPKFHDGVSHELKKLGVGYEILYVDNGSLDNSPGTLQEILAKDGEHTQLLFLPTPLPPEDLFQAAVHKSRGEYCILLPADGSIPLSGWTRLVEKLVDGADLVCGRQPDRTNNLLRWPAAWLYAHVLARPKGTGRHDLYCDALAARRDILEALLPTPRGLGRYLPAFAMRAGLRVEDCFLEYNDFADTPGPYPTNGYASITDISNSIRAGNCIFGPAAVYNAISLVGLAIGGLFGIGAFIQAMISGFNWPALLIMLPALALSILSGVAWLLGTTSPEPEYGVQLRNQRCRRSK